MSFSISRPLLWGGHCQFAMFIVDDGICFVISFHGGWSKTCHFFYHNEINRYHIEWAQHSSITWDLQWRLCLSQAQSLNFKLGNRIVVIVCFYFFFLNPEQFGATGHCLCKWCYHGYAISPGYVSKICNFIIKQNLTLNSIC